METQDLEENLEETPLATLHRELGARMVPFAGYTMPVQYEAGILAEHLHTRKSASLFDVSHMGQAMVRAGTQEPSLAMERLVCGDLASLAPGAMRYTLLTNEGGFIRDDLMATRLADGLHLTLNAGQKEKDQVWIKEGLGNRAHIEPLAGQAMLAVQGPQAARAMAQHIPGIENLPYMTGAPFAWRGAPVFVTRSGYTGEDGFEISLPGSVAETFARTLLEESDGVVRPAGLGARDALRLEAGYCLYGQDIDETTTPVAAGLSWVIGKSRREKGGFPGADPILAELRDPPIRCRIGMVIAGRAPIRAGAVIEAPDSTEIGTITSSAFSPGNDQWIAMGYVDAGHNDAGLELTVRQGTRMAKARIARPPFIQLGHLSSRVRPEVPGKKNPNPGKENS